MSGGYVDPGIAELVEMIGDFLAGRTGPGTFSDGYQARYSGLVALDERVFVALDRLFFVCEDFYDDVSLRDPDDPDEAALRGEARRALDELPEPSAWGTRG